MPWRGWLHLGLEVTWATAQVGSLSYLVSHYALSSAVMSGNSMAPTFAPAGDVVLVEHVSHRWGRLAPGAVVVCVSPDSPREHVCKRVVATEGQQVLLSRSYPTPVRALITVPPGHIWLQGDNVRTSKDSRTYGPVPQALVQGVVLAQVWPLSRMRWIEKELPPALAAALVSS